MSADSGAGKGWRNVAPKRVGRKQGIALQGFALRSPGGGARELRVLQCLEVARAKELRVLRVGAGGE